MMKSDMKVTATVTVQGVDVELATHMLKAHIEPGMLMLGLHLVTGVQRPSISDTHFFVFARDFDKDVAQHGAIDKRIRASDETDGVAG